jgi:hypothetical protein
LKTATKKDKIEFVTYRQWDSYKTRCENAEMKRNGTSRMLGGPLFNEWIIEHRPYEKRMLVKQGWREAMKHAAVATNIPLGFVVDNGIMRRKSS